MSTSRPRTTQSQRQLAVKLVLEDGYSLRLAAQTLNLSIIQVRYALRMAGVPKLNRATGPQRVAAEPKPLDPSVEAALQAVRDGVSVSKAALAAGMTMNKLSYHMRKLGLKSAHARPGVSHV